MSRSILVIVVVIASALAACAPHRFACPARGGAEWREVRTAHFILRTDVEDVELLVGDLETMYEAVTQVVPRREGASGPGALLAIAFASGEEFREFAPRGVGAFVRSTSMGELQIVLDASGRAARRMVAAHEIAHAVLLRSMPRQPFWFSEGAAHYLSSVGLRPRGVAPTVGAELSPMLRAYRERGLHVRDAFGAGAQPLDGQLHALSLALVHFLATEHAERFEAFQRRLTAAEDPADAFREVYPEWDPRKPAALDALDAALAAHVDSGRFSYRTLSVRPDLRHTSRAMASTEVHGVRLSLPRSGPRSEPIRMARIAEAEEALGEDGADPSALILLARERGGDKVLAARRATEAHPEVALAWAALGDELPEGSDEAGAAFRRAVDAGPGASVPRNNLAWNLLKRGRAAEALPFSESAVALSPWSAPALDTYAAVLGALGRCPEALEVQRRVMEVAASGRPSAESRAIYLDRLVRLEASCGRVAGSEERGDGRPERGSP